MKRNLRINKSYLPAVLVLIGLSLALLAMACGGYDLGANASKAWTRAHGDASKAEDVCGATISKDRYRQFDHKEGWDVDHIIPLDRGGRNESTNLRPMQRQNNIAKDNKEDPKWICVEGDRAGLPPF